MPSTSSKIRYFPAILLWLLILPSPSCRSEKPSNVKANPPQDRASCPAEAPAPLVLPHEKAEHRLLAYWLPKIPHPTKLLLSPAEVKEHNDAVHRLSDGGWPSGRWVLNKRKIDQQKIRARFATQTAGLQQAIDEKGRYDLRGKLAIDFVAPLKTRMRSSKERDEFRVAFRSTPLRCFPTNDPLYEKPRDYAFDLMQCSQIHPGDLLRILAETSDFYYVWSSYAGGWVDKKALTPALSDAALKAYASPQSWAILTKDNIPVFDKAQGGTMLAAVRLGSRFPQSGGNERIALLFPTATGLRSAFIDRDALSLDRYPALNRKDFLALAFSQIDRPYGWGGSNDYRDCSRLLMDTFAVFGIELPRNSSKQAEAGRQRIEVGDLDPAKKEEAIEKAAEKGLVLLYMPGHIMLYVGRDGSELYGFHLFSGFIQRCESPPGGETTFRVNRAAVTSLSLGEGGSRRSFLQRITRLVVFGG